MDLQTALLTRRTHSVFTDQPVSDEALDRAILAGHHAPCHKRTWPWRFVKLGPVAREALVGVALSVLEAKKGPLAPEAVATTRKKLLRPPAAVAVVQVLSDDAFTRKEDYAACSAALQNMMLSLHADGYGTKWSTSRFLEADAALEAVGFEAEGHEIVGMLLIGAPCATRDACRPEVDGFVRSVP